MGRQELIMQWHTHKGSLSKGSCQRVPLGHWLTIYFKKVLTSLLWEMKKDVKTLITFFLFP